MWIKQINLLFPDSSVGKESTCNGWRPQFDSWVRKICWRRDRLPTLVFLGFPCGSAGKESACNSGDLGSIPRLGRSPGEENGWSRNSEEQQWFLQTVNLGGGNWKCQTSDLMLLKKYKREPDAWNKHVVLYLESEHHFPSTPLIPSGWSPGCLSWTLAAIDKELVSKIF